MKKLNKLKIKKNVIEILFKLADDGVELPPVLQYEFEQQLIDADSTQFGIQPFETVPFGDMMI